MSVHPRWPTWLPDWRLGRLARIYGDESQYFREPFRAAGDSDAIVNVMDDTGILKCEGVCLGSISEVHWESGCPLAIRVNDDGSRNLGIGYPQVMKRLQTLLAVGEGKQ